jgi:hypothetical protein
MTNKSNCLPEALEGYNGKVLRKALPYNKEKGIGELGRR